MILDNTSKKSSDNPVALITGGARRIGKKIALTLHSAGYDIMVHYRSSAGAAEQLVNKLNSAREGSAASFGGDLLDLNIIPKIVEATIERFSRLDVLINNASTFYPTPIELINEEFWDNLIGSNLRAPAFLIKSATSHLRESSGSIVNIIDIYAQNPLRNHPIYCSAKAGLAMLTKSLALDLAPEIRVNGVAPGAILWPENDNAEISQVELIARVPLNRLGRPHEVANTVRFLVQKGTYITGQVIAVDGGRSIVI